MFNSVCYLQFLYNVLWDVSYFKANPKAVFLQSVDPSRPISRCVCRPSRRTWCRSLRAAWRTWPSGEEESWTIRWGIWPVSPAGWSASALTTGRRDRSSTTWTWPLKSLTPATSPTAAQVRTSQHDSNYSQTQWCLQVYARTRDLPADSSSMCPVSLSTEQPCH